MLVSRNFFHVVSALQSIVCLNKVSFSCRYYVGSVYRMQSLAVSCSSFFLWPFTLQLSSLFSLSTLTNPSSLPSETIDKPTAPTFLPILFIFYRKTSVLLQNSFGFSFYDTICTSQVNPPSTLYKQNKLTIFAITLFNVI